MARTRGVNPIWWIPDLIGNPMDDTYYLFVLSNEIPYIPLTVTHDFEGNVPWINPIQMLSNGTVPIDVYFDEDTIYRLEWRTGPTQADTLVYEVDNYIPEGGGSAPTVDSANNTTNQITNPQFALINFNPVTGIQASTSANLLNIAPGWDIIANGGGSGTITVTRITVEGDQKDTSNPSYALSIQSTGWPSISLRQTFEGNGALWTSGPNGTSISGVALEISAYNTGAGSPPTITGRIDYPGSTDDNPDVFAWLINSAPNQYGGAIPLDPSLNTQGPDVASTVVSFTWPTGNTVVITSIQLIGQQGDDIAQVAYQQDTIERQVDQTFHYYQPQLNYKPIPSYAIGWDFGFNPCQELGKTVSVVNTGNDGSFYIADQTIIFQSVTSSISAVFDNTGMTVSTVNTTPFAIIQYLDASTAVELLNQRICSMLSGYISTGTGTLNGSINLFWTANATVPTISSPSYDSLVTSITATTPSVVSGWTAVPQGYLGPANFTLSTTPQTFSLSGWDATQVSGINTATFFAIVVVINNITSAQQVKIPFISLCGGDIPTRPAPLSESQTLRALQYYYEKSYAPNVLPGTVTPVGQKYYYNTIGTANNGTDYTFNTQSFELEYNQTCRVNDPLITFYSPAVVTPDRINCGILRSGIYPRADSGTNPFDIQVSTNWTATGPSADRTFFKCNKTTTIRMTIPSDGGQAEALVLYHYVRDARFGVVLS